MLSHEFQEAVRWFKERGFKGEYGEYGWVASDGMIRLAIWTDEAPEPYANKLMMETEETFNKWSQAYYVREELPKNKHTWKLVENEMEIIQSSFHKKRANEFEHFFPVEDWQD